MTPQGYLALVLHAHLPFVRHPEYDEFLEEDWFYEAITETYIPLVNMMDGLLNDNCDFRLTMSITPPLAAMLGDQLLQDRYVRTKDGWRFAARVGGRARFARPVEAGDGGRLDQAGAGRIVDRGDARAASRARGVSANVP